MSTGSLKWAKVTSDFGKHGPNDASNTTEDVILHILLLSVIVLIGLKYELQQTMKFTL